MSFFTLTVDSSDLKRKLRRMGNVRAQRVLDIVAEDLAAAVVDRIDSRGDGEWPDLADSTKDRKGSDAPLIDTGQLRGSIRPEAGADWAMASTSVEYIVYHLDGGSVIPKRNPFELTDAALDPIGEDIARLVALEMENA